jgi:molybdate transport system substrate-binding protein
MTAPISMISSMATRALLAELVAGFEQAGGGSVQSLAVGGVDAAKRVREGEAFDVVALASNAIDALIADGHVRAGSRVDLVHSGVAVAVRAGTPQPALSTAADVRAAVLAAPSIGFSTGPSGVELVKLFTAWGLGEHLAARTVTAPPGVPVGALVADGRVALGFQQLSELMALPGIDVVGPLPPDVQITTTFSAGIASVSAQPDAAHALIAHLAAPATADAKRRHGMQPA